MYIPVEEQETVIQIDRLTRMARIYTTDARVITKLDKQYDRYMVHKQDRRIIGVEYQVPENLISYRKGTTKKRVLTEAEKAERASRLKKGKEKKG